MEKASVIYKVFILVLLIQLVVTGELKADGCSGSLFTPQYSQQCGCWEMAGNLISDCDLILSADWDFGDGNIASGENPCHKYAVPGNYTITVTISGFCHFGVQTCDIVSNITVIPAQVGVRNVDLGNDTILDLGDTLTLTAGLGFGSYIWSTGDSSTSIIVSDNGVYSVTVTDSTGCPETDDITVHFCDFQDIPIKAGWNLISAYVNPGVYGLPYDVQSILAPIANEILIARDRLGGEAFPSIASLNFFWYVNDGYHVLATKDTILKMGCLIVDPITKTINLFPGWNQIAYLGPLQCLCSKL